MKHPNCGLGSTDYSILGVPSELKLKEEETPSAFWVVIH